MSMGAVGKTTNNPRENVAVQLQSERESMLGEMPGEVVSFDASNQTITVQPLYRPVHNGEPVDMPELQEVPIRFPNMGGFVITAPVKAGDKVTLRPQMRSGEEYHTGGAYETPNDNRSMSLSDMEAFLDGGEPVSSPISNFNNSNFEIRSSDGAFKFEMSESGQFKMEGAQGNVYDILAQVVELLASDELDIKNGSPTQHGHALQNRALYLALGAKLRGMTL